MTSLSREAEIVQNPGLGSLLIWRFACGYCRESETRTSAPLPLSFVVLPILWHDDSFEKTESTRKNLRAFADKLASSSEAGADAVLAIHTRMLRWKHETRRAIQIGLATRLISISASDAALLPLTETEPAGAPEEIKKLMRTSEKLGRWCARLSLFEIATILKVQF